jgi:PAS domain-containing protein
MDPASGPPPDGRSLLSVLAEGASRTSALSVLHDRAMLAVGARCSLLYESHPAGNVLQATSGAGLEFLPSLPWTPGAREEAAVGGIFAGRVAVAFANLPAEMPGLHEQLGERQAIVLPLETDSRRLGLLAIGLESGAERGLGLLRDSDVPTAFLLALELSGLRQREAFEHDVRRLLDAFTDRLAQTLDLPQALEPLCVGAARLFASDRATVWLHNRETRALEALASSDASFAAGAAPVRTDDALAPASAALRNPGAGIASRGSEPTGVLTVPLRGCRRALGTIVFDGVRVEPGDDLALLRRADELGRHLSSAIETMQLLHTVARSRRELELVFSSFPHLIVVVGVDGQILRTNDVFAAALGRPADALRGVPLGECTGSELTAWLASLAAPLDGAATTELTDSVIGGPYLVTATDLVTDPGGPSGRVIVARDMASVTAAHQSR